MGILTDHDPGETREWIDSLKAVVQHVGVERARYLMGRLRDEAQLIGARPTLTATTRYRCDPVDIGKTIHPHPTLGESIGMAAEVFEGVCTYLPPAKKK
jgi:pyruvate dehydrogenase complex dehydrogenase (E1) component